MIMQWNRIHLTFTLLFTTLLVLCGGCLGTNPRLRFKGGPYYFSNWQVPFDRMEMYVLEKDRISDEEATVRQSEGKVFIEAYFDEYGRIIIFKKHARGLVTYLDRYTYRQDNQVWRIEAMMRSHGDTVLLWLIAGGITIKKWSIQIPRNEDLVWPECEK